jgi:Ca2+/Na+ antiporter
VPGTAAVAAQLDLGSTCSMAASPLWLNILIFLVAAVAVWIAGISLSNQTDVLATRWHLGAALGGVVLLAVATNLPEIAITASAALAGNIGVAVRNILGGIALQTVVLVVLDAFGRRHGRPLTYRAASLVLVVEGLLVVAVLVVVVGDDQLAVSDIFGGNAFLPVLFLLATLLSGKAVLPQAHATDIYLTGVGLLLTVVYIAGLLLRPGRRVLGMGMDSLTVLVLYLISLGGLFAIAAIQPAA